MGWGFRKSVNLGPLRVNASKSGLGYSFGGRGFRVGRDAKGRSYTAASIPGTGIYNRSYRSKAAVKARPAQPPALGASPQQKQNAASASGSGRTIARMALYGLAASGIYLAVSAVLHLL